MAFQLQEFDFKLLLIVDIPALEVVPQAELCAVGAVPVEQAALGVFLDTGLRARYRVNKLLLG